KAKVPNTSIVEIRHLIRDVKHEFQEIKKANQNFITDFSSGFSACNLPLSLLQQHTFVLSSLKFSFMLVPLFEIQDPEGKQISTAFFERNVLFNGLAKDRVFETGITEYSFFGERRRQNNVLNHLFLNGKKLKLPHGESDNLFVFLILTNPLSETPMLYLGFRLHELNFTSGEDFNILYDKYVSKASEEVISSEAIEDAEKYEFSISLNFKSLIDGLNFSVFDKIEQKFWDFKLLPSTQINLIENNILIKLKGKINSSGLFFEVEKQGVDVIKDIKITVRPTDHDSSCYLYANQMN
ncbi:hypothetical protein CDIK_3953, partial [Cucumispora dikerogammari]